MFFSDNPINTNFLEPLRATVRVNNGSGVICQIPGNSPIVVTAFHVVKDSAEVVIRIASVPGFIMGKVVVSDESADLAIVSYSLDSHMSQEISIMSCLSESEKAHIGDELWVLGYPTGWNSDNPLITRATLAGVGTEVWISSDCSWGNSGGPVIKETIEGCKLIGVIVGNVGAVHEDLNKIRRTLQIIEGDPNRSRIAKVIATTAKLLSEMVATHFRTGFIKIASLDDIISLLR